MRLLGGDKEGVMTTWQLFIQGLGYLMLVDLGCLLMFCGIAWLKSLRERREVAQLKAMYAREGR